MSPPILHALPGSLVRLITPCNHFFQMVIFRFYNLISRISMEWGITWSTHLSTSHCLHLYQLLLSKVQWRHEQLAPRADCRCLSTSRRLCAVATQSSSVPVGVRTVSLRVAPSWIPVGAKSPAVVLLTVSVQRDLRRSQMRYVSFAGLLTGTEVVCRWRRGHSHTWWGIHGGGKTTVPAQERPQGRRELP
jgi:hypothetical protein